MPLEISAGLYYENARCYGISYRYIWSQQLPLIIVQLFPIPIWKSRLTVKTQFCWTWTECYCHGSEKVCFPHVKALYAVLYCSADVQFRESVSSASILNIFYLVFVHPPVTCLSWWHLCLSLYLSVYAFLNTATQDQHMTETVSAHGQMRCWITLLNKFAY